MFNASLSREGMKMSGGHFLGNPVGLDRVMIPRHSGGSQNPVFSAWVSGLQKNESQSGITVFGGQRELGAFTPGFPPSRE
jgi:hypothetical protein